MGRIAGWLGPAAAAWFLYEQFWVAFILCLLVAILCLWSGFFMARQAREIAEARGHAEVQVEDMAAVANGVTLINIASSLAVYSFAIWAAVRAF